MYIMVNEGCDMLKAEIIEVDEDIALIVSSYSNKILDARFMKRDKIGSKSYVDHVQNLLNKYLIALFCCLIIIKI